MEKPYTTIHPNATSVRSHNRKVTVVSSDDHEELGIQFLIVNGNIEPRYGHSTRLGAVFTSLRLTREGAEQLLYCLQNELEKTEKYSSETINYDLKLKND
jgi:hypothetical protein